MASAEPHFKPSINPNNHGPRVVIAGAIMLAATVLMLVICFWNRYNARTMHHWDSLLILLGAALNIACFSVYAVAVGRGFGQHKTMLSNTELPRIEGLFLVGLLLFYSSHGVTKLSYNMLARKTSRNHSLQRVIDGFTGIIGLWTLSNVVVMSVALARRQSPARAFFWASGVISILIILGQLAVFLWIIWRTRAKIMVKVQWSISMGAVVPMCVSAILVRLVYTPSNYFGADWTFDDVFQAMIFLIELNLVTITILAPNLPVFFKKTSTGGVYFLPGEAVGSSDDDTRSSNRKAYRLSSMPWSTTKSDGGTHTNGPENTVTFSTSQKGEDRFLKRTSFDSNRILIRTSIEIERGLERPEIELQSPREL